MVAEDQIAAIQADGVDRILNCLPSTATEQDWQIQNAVNSGLVAIESALPSAKDLRDNSWWSINDQGSTGSCVGWALADSVLRWHFVQSGRLTRADEMSSRFIWMASKETDEFTTEPSTFVEQAGTSLKSALDVARRYGAVRDSNLPFTSSQLYPGSVNTFYALAAQLKIVAYFNLGRTLQDWRQWLANNGPILVRLGVDQTWDRATQSNGNLDTYLPDTARGGHAVALVGYTPDRFIVRNSWGPGWGSEGYAYASADYAAAAFTEAYGVTVLPGPGPAPVQPGARSVWHR